MSTAHTSVTTKLGCSFWKNCFPQREKPYIQTVTTSPGWANSFNEHKKLSTRPQFVRNDTKGIQWVNAFEAWKIIQPGMLASDKSFRSEAIRINLVCKALLFGFILSDNKQLHQKTHHVCLNQEFWMLVEWHESTFDITPNPWGPFKICIVLPT